MQIQRMTQVGAWRLLELRNGGAYGYVYRAEPLHSPGADPVALKLAIHPRDPRFLREAGLLRRVPHPHIPRLFDFGLWEHPEGPFPYLVMEWIEGQSLYDWAHGRGLSSRQMMRVLAPMAEALATTHAADAVHRDVKGDNILVRLEDSHPMLLDFGAGDFRGAPTLTHEVLPPGTPGYRSPEALQFQERFWRTPGAHYKPGPSDDLYALGVTAYRLATGTYPPPWVPAEVREHEPSFPTPASEPPEKWVTVCPELAGVIRRLLSEDPPARGSAAQIAEDLHKAVESAGRQADEPVTLRPEALTTVRKSRPRSSRPARDSRPWLATAAGLTATAGIALALTLHGERDAGPQPAPLPQEDWARSNRKVDSPDAGTSLATEVVASRVQVEQPRPTGEGIRKQVPKKPLPRQVQAPCKQRNEVEINGGCWIRPEVSTPPCGEREYEWGGRCYYPVLTPTPPATSDQE
ncbi:MAG TPA: protein kinase [Hyalangium sp.]|nr:protein kinase [Hyalangium sp.]